MTDTDNTQSKTAWYEDPKWYVPYQPPMSVNRFKWIIWASRCLSWGMTSALYKIFSAVKRHPWVATLGVGGAVAMCPTCVYSTGCIIGGLAIWAVKSETEHAQEEAENHPAPETGTSENNPAGEFMQ